MKITAIILNLVLLISSILMTIEEGVPDLDTGVWLLLFILIYIAPIASLIALLLSKSDNWIGLYFKRKAMEEKQRIKALEGQ